MPSRCRCSPTLVPRVKTSPAISSLLFRRSLSSLIQFYPSPNSTVPWFPISPRLLLSFLRLLYSNIPSACIRPTAWLSLQCSLEIAHSSVLYIIITRLLFLCERVWWWMRTKVSERTRWWMLEDVRAYNDRGKERERRKSCRSSRGEVICFDRKWICFTHTREKG